MRARSEMSLFFLLAIAAAPTLGQTAPGTEPAVDRPSLERRMHQVNVLLQTSSAAKQVDASGDVAALERREEARRVYARAVDAFQAGQLPKASQLLQEASVRMFEAVRMAAPEKVTAEKMRTDFDARMNSVKSLLGAQKRIAAEKPGTLNATQATASIEESIREAERLDAKGDLKAARATLDRAYLIAKAAISSMRGGDTLVRSLNFANAEEEYRYEIDRNDTHQMLVKVLLVDKRATAAADAMVQGFVDKAAGLRERAEGVARGGDPHGAIRLLEESTRELVRAIRGAGVYIPG